MIVAGKKKLICLAGLLIMCLCVSCTSDEPQESPAESPSAAETTPVPETPGESLPATEAVPVTETPADTEGPVIPGVQPLTVLVGGTPNYRDGVTAVDDLDGPVPFQVDSSQVDLNVPGEYEVIYSAEDSSGNRTEVTATVVVTEPEPTPPPEETESTGASLEKVNALADQILAKIIDDSMSQR